MSATRRKSPRKSTPKPTMYIGINLCFECPPAEDEQGGTVYWRRARSRREAIAKLRRIAPECCSLAAVSTIEELEELIREIRK